VSVHKDEAAGRRISPAVAPPTCKLVEKTRERQANQDHGDNGIHEHEENLSV
jgi:hypothetical protein